MSIALSEKELQKEMRELQRAMGRHHKLGFQGMIKDSTKEFLFQASKQKDRVIASAFSFLGILFSVISMMSLVAVTGYQYSKISDCKIKLKELKRSHKNFEDTDQHMQEVKEAKNNRKAPGCDFEMTL